MEATPIKIPANILEIFRKVMESESQCVLEASKRIGEEVIKAVHLILSSRGRCIVSGMGKSGLIGRKISATLSSTGTPSFFMHPSEALHGDLGMVTEEDVMLLLSHSGETEEMVRLVPFLRRIGTKIVSITGNPESQLAKLADVNLDGSVPREACPLNRAPTNSTTVALALGDALAIAILEARGFKEKDFARLHPSGSLGKRFLKVSDLMLTGDRIPLGTPDISLKEAIIRMSRGGLGTLLIVDNSDKLIGILTDGDLRRFFEKYDGSVSVPVSAAMTNSPKTIAPDKLAMEALKLMESKSITALPVIENDKVVGILHLHHILRSRLV